MEKKSTEKCRKKNNVSYIIVLVQLIKTNWTGGHCRRIWINLNVKSTAKYLFSVQHSSG